MQIKNIDGECVESIHIVRHNVVGKRVEVFFINGDVIQYPNQWRSPKTDGYKTLENIIGGNAWEKMLETDEKEEAWSKIKDSEKS